MRDHWRLHLMVRFIVLVLAVSAAAAQAPPPPEPGADVPEQELQAAIRQFFEQRMREELALSDEQMTAIRPLVEEIERSRAQTRRERMETVRSLRDGIREGMNDQQLQQLLDGLDRLDEEQRARERSAMARIDEQLSVRQRVQFRFFTEAFRRGMEDRIRELRQGRGRPPARAPLERRPLPPPGP